MQLEKAESQQQEEQSSNHANRILTRPRAVYNNNNPNRNRNSRVVVGKPLSKMDVQSRV
jgi:hypothetical protein